MWKQKPKRKIDQNSLQCSDLPISDIIFKWPLGATIMCWRCVEKQSKVKNPTGFRTTFMFKHEVVQRRTQPGSCRICLHRKWLIWRLCKQNFIQAKAHWCIRQHPDCLWPGHTSPKWLCPSASQGQAQKHWLQWLCLLLWRLRLYRDETVGFFSHSLNRGRKSFSILGE